MDYGALYAFLTAVGFKTNTLTVRLLQEKGVAVLDTYSIYRFALIPAIAWSLIFIKQKDLNLIFHSTELLVMFGLIIILWNLQAYLMALVINSTDSMILFSTIFNMLLLPLFLAFGTFYNHDTPNVLSLSAIIILMLALLIKPTSHKENLRPRLSKPLYVILLLIFLKAACDTVLQGVAREAMKQVSPSVFLGAFSVPTLAVCWLISSFYIHRSNEVSPVMKQKQLLAIALIPLIWFAASIPESFSLAAIPIYVFISINVVTFLMDTVSDLMHKRIHLTFQTMSFIATVLIGLTLSVLSI